MNLMNTLKINTIRIIFLNSSILLQLKKRKFKYRTLNYLC